MFQTAQTHTEQTQLHSNTLLTHKFGMLNKISSSKVKLGVECTCTAVKHSLTTPKIAIFTHSRHHHECRTNATSTTIISNDQVDKQHRFTPSKVKSDMVWWSKAADTNITENSKNTGGATRLCCYYESEPIRGVCTHFHDPLVITQGQVTVIGVASVTPMVEGGAYT